MKTGKELISDERQEQIEKHGWDLEHDEDYGNNELERAAEFCLNTNCPSLWPWQDCDCGIYFMNKVINKSEKQRLIVAGAFYRAEQDRNKTLFANSENDFQVLNHNRLEDLINKIAAEIDKLQCESASQSMSFDNDPPIPHPEFNK